MNDLKITPGPWRVNPWNSDLVIAGDGDPNFADTIAQVYRINLHTTLEKALGNPHNTGIGNALAISALPDIIEALEAMLDSSSTLQLTAEEAEARRMGEMALKKARGEQI